MLRLMDILVEVHSSIQTRVVHLRTPPPSDDDYESLVS
jgi:hypothetical protein